MVTFACQGCCFTLSVSNQLIPPVPPITSIFPPQSVQAAASLNSLLCKPLSEKYLLMVPFSVFTWFKPQVVPIQILPL